MEPQQATQDAPDSAAPRKSGITELFGTVLILCGILIFLALLSYSNQIATGAAPRPEANMIGTFGHYSSEFLMYLFGNSSFLLGPYLVILGALTIVRGGFTDPVSRIVAVLTVMIGTSLFGALVFGNDREPSETVGGILGSQVGSVFQTLFGVSGAVIVALGIFTTGAFLAIRVPIPVFFNRVRREWQRFAARYGSFFGRELYAGLKSGPAESPVEKKTEPAPPATPVKPEIVEQRESEDRPWFEKRVVDEEAMSADQTGAVTETNEAAEEQLVASEAVAQPQEFEEDYERIPEGLDPYAQAEQETGTNRPNRFRAGTHARQLGEILNDWSGQKNEDPPEDMLEGYFDQDESRFHFRSAFPASGRRSFERKRDQLRRHWDREPTPSERFWKPKEERQRPSPDRERLMRPVNLSVLDTSSRPGEANDGRTQGRPEHAGVAADTATLDLSRAPVTEEQLESYQEVPPESVYEDEASPVQESYGYETERSTAGESPEDTSEEDLALQETQAAEPETTPEKDAPTTQGALPSSFVPDFVTRSRRYFIPTDILEPARPLAQGDVTRDIDRTREKLEQVMRDYGIAASVVRTQRGPIITLYEIKLEPGIKVSRVLGISDEIKMNLEAASVRIIAPIPGKSTIGIEIPNRQREPVLCGELLREETKRRGNSRELSIVLGKNIAGEIMHVDLTRLPHLLIAGATGAGKSVYMNSVIASLLYTRAPEDVRFLMIDPKMVELKLFEGVPHLLHPVITDVRLASKALTWLVAEMERRYKILSHLRCRDIRSYNDRLANGNLDRKAAGEEPLKRMPYVVVLIDELSDLMMVAAKDVEDSIIRLTQKARAVGIHVIMATQRPSVDVITALIKANCPARIAFHVAQKTDSRTILDANGAETLLGKGDMLYKSPSATGLMRIQAPLITENEIERIVQETRRFGDAVTINLDDADEAGSRSDAEEVDEELFQEAWEVVLESGKTSTSYIQRRLRIGYNRAANLIEEMERRGYLSEAIGNKPREILKRS